MLTQIEIGGFKSICFQRIQLRDLNVLIGANGAGKSNLIDLFRMLSWMSLGEQFQTFIGKGGGASDFLFDGAEVTTECHVNLTFRSDGSESQYAAQFLHAAPDALIFAHEKYRSNKSNWIELGSGHRESALHGTEYGAFILRKLKGFKTFQFHNTSETARIRQKWDVEDHLYLHEDGANLAAYLLAMRNHQRPHYQRIIKVLQRVAPYFDDFLLEPEYGKVLLRWREKGSPKLFGPHLVSDGTLRMMALVTLLLQPTEKLPQLLLLDEPELGLHPTAIQILADLIIGASEHTQIIIATQSTNLIDHFEPGHILVTERQNHETIFKRLDTDQLLSWLEDYTLAELWEKNVLGGKP